MRIMIGVVITAALSASLPAASRGQDAKGPEKPRKPHFTIGKETTYVTEPVDKDGYIDYVTAVNERLRRGVTPDNNAVVLLWKALGPHPGGAAPSPEFFRWLGVPTPAGDGEYYVDVGRYLSQKDPRKPAEQRTREADRARQRPWTAQQYPHIAAWL